MVAITERAEWAEQIRQIEANDPVQGGENGIDNIPHQQLANRTAYLKKQFDDLKKNHLSNNDLENSLDSDDSNKALTANQGKILKELIDSKSSQDDFTQSFAQNGYCKLPNGLVLQWGFVPASQLRIILAQSRECSAVVNLPIAFQHHCLNATATIKATKVGYWLDLFAQVVAFDNTSLTLQTATIEGYINADGYDGIFWQAIGF